MESILTEALEVRKAREAQYGSAESNLSQIAAFLNLAGFTFQGKPLAATDVATIMIFTKLSRELFKHKHDNLVDIAGYSDIKEAIYGIRKNVGADKDEVS